MPITQTTLGPAGAGVVKKSTPAKGNGTVSEKKLKDVKQRLGKAALRELKKTTHTTHTHMPWSEVKLTIQPEEATALLSHDLIDGEFIGGKQVFVRSFNFDDGVGRLGQWLNCPGLEATFPIKSKVKVWMAAGDKRAGKYMGVMREAELKAKGGDLTLRLRSQFANCMVLN